MILSSFCKNLKSCHLAVLDCILSLGGDNLAVLKCIY